MARPRFLVIDEGILADWGSLRSLADVSVLRLDGPLAPFRQLGTATPREVEAGLAIARAHAGRFDYVLAECAGAFLWHCLFRLAGDRTPFVIVPRFNCVHAADAYAAFLSSRVAEPNDVVFCGSVSACRAFEALGLRCSPRFLPGIDLERFRPLGTCRAKLRESLGASAEGDLLLYVGRLADDKNVLELFTAVQKVCEIRNVELVVCYHFPRDGYFRRCRELAAALGMVRFVEDPDPPTLVRWYNAADLFVSAAVSIFETFGRAPVEAMACGTPPVVSAYNGFRETVSPRSGYLVPTALDGIKKTPDVDRFAAAVLSALEDRPQLAKKAAAGVRQARRFERTSTLTALLDELDGGRWWAREVPHGKRDRLSFEGCSPEVADLWAPLSGQPVRDLVVDFIRSGRVPVQPPEAAVRRFYLSWFAHF